MADRKLKVFLGDLVHTWEKVGLWTFPINLGFVGGYALKHLPDDVTLRLFKRPEAMIDAIRDETPDVVALSFYVWNTRLNSLVMGIAKEENPRCLTVGGGPIFTDLNANEKAAKPFFADHPHCDAFVVNQGEAPFLEVLKRFIKAGADPGKFRDGPTLGALINGNAGCLVSPPLPALGDLNEIPSPYLNGLMDSFFDDAFTPQIETNRSCPYRCTFCAWGIGTKKLSRFDRDRIFAEIDYIADRTTRSAEFIICDANFGILPRDVEIAAHIDEARNRTGYPGHVSAQWSKAKPERVVEVAAAMEGLSEVTASLQTTNERSLEVIKRRNLPLERVTDLTDELFRSKGIRINVFSELILGLPEETRESHLEANRYLMDRGVESRNYNLHLLPGTEMDTKDSREKYFHKTAWRMHDGCYGIYDGVKIIEGQEVVLQTSTMSMEELKRFRFLHFLIQFMWSKKYFIDYLCLLRSYGIHPLDAILAVDMACRSDEGEVGEMFKRFKGDHGLEQFDSCRDLFDYWNADEPFERLRAGDYGKLNFQFSVEILMDIYDPFSRLLEEVGRRLLAEVDSPDSALDQCSEVLRFSAALRLRLTDDLDIISENREDFAYDFQGWRDRNRRGFPEGTGNGSRFALAFFLEEAQRRNLEKQLSQYRSHNARMTLRTMAVYMSPDDLFYNARFVS